MRRHPIRQRASGEVRHDEGDVVAVLDHLEELDDVRVIEARQHLGLALDPLTGAGDVLGRSVEGEAFEGHQAAVRRPGQVDHPHTASSEAGHPLIGHLMRLGAGLRLPVVM